MHSSSCVARDFFKNDTLRYLVAFTPRWGGLRIFNTTTLSAQEYSASLNMTETLSHHIGSGYCVDYFQLKSEQLSRKCEIRLSKQSMYSNTSACLRVQLDHASQVSLDLATTRKVSAWLSALPLTEHGFTLHKAVIHNAIALRYGWLLHRTPSNCACGTIFSVDHALSCHKVVFLPFGTMKSGALLLVSCLKCVIRFKWSLFYSLSAILVHLFYPQLTLKEVLVCTLLYM